MLFPYKMLDLSDDGHEQKIFSKVEFSISVYNNSNIVIRSVLKKKDNVPDAVMILGKLKIVPW